MKPLIATLLLPLALAEPGAPPRPTLPKVFSEVLPSSARYMPRHPSGEKVVLERALDELVPALIEEFPVPGTAIGVVRSGSVVYARGFGLADAERAAPVTQDTLFNVASISKAVTAWGVLGLVDDGRLDLDAPVESYVKRWRLPESAYDHTAVTLRRVLSHTAGLSVGEGPGFFHDGELPTLERTLDGLSEAGAGVPSPEEILSGKLNGPAGIRVVYEPGSEVRYSNGGYRLLQLVVEETAEQPFADYMQARILDPLGMRRSSFRDPLRLRGERAKLATPYDWRGNAIPVERSVGVAAGGLFSSLNDMLRFARAEIGRGDGGVLPGALLETMHRPVAPSPYFALGHVVRKIGDFDIVGHTGLTMGWNASLQTVPRRDAAIVVLTNGDNGSYVHETLICAWSRAELGVGLPECASAARKRLNRLSGILEWLVETGTLDAKPAQPLEHAVDDAKRAVDAMRFGDGLTAMDSLRKAARSLRDHRPSLAVAIEALIAHSEAVSEWLASN